MVAGEYDSCSKGVGVSSGDCGDGDDGAEDETGLGQSGDGE